MKNYFKNEDYKNINSRKSNGMYLTKCENFKYNFLSNSQELKILFIFLVEFLINV